MISKIRRAISSDGGLLGRAGLALVLRGLGAALAFAFSVAVARLLGESGAGLYFTALSVATIGSVIGRLGLDNAMLRLIADARADDDWPRARSLYRLGMSRAALACAVIGAGMLVLAPVLAERLFEAPEATMPIRVMSLATLSLSMMMLNAEAIKALKRVGASMLVSGVIYPVVGLALLWPLAGMLGAVGACLAYVLGTAAAAAIGQVIWRAAGPRELSLEPVGDALWSSARPLWPMTIINRAVTPWAPVVMLGIWGTTADVGVFGAATRLAMIMALFLAAVNAVLAPRFVELYKRGALERLDALARRFALIVTACVSPIFLVLILAGGPVMGIFGPEFTRGGLALSILAIGQAFNTLTGPVVYILMMSGHETDARRSAIAAALATICIALLAMPALPLIGAALAGAGGVVVNNALAAYHVYIRLGIVAVPGLSRFTLRR